MKTAQFAFRSIVKTQCQFYGLLLLMISCPITRISHGSNRYHFMRSTPKKGRGRCEQRQYFDRFESQKNMTLDHMLIRLAADNDAFWVLKTRLRKHYRLFVSHTISAVRDARESRRFEEGHFSAQATLRIIIRERHH